MERGMSGYYPRVNRIVPLLAVVALAACGIASKEKRAPPAPTPAQPLSAPAPRTDVLVARARALRADGDVAGARARLEAALALAPGAEDARVELADLLVADGQELPRAAELLAGVGELDPRVHLVRARLAEALADDGVAATEYGLALGAADDPDVRLRLALALERLGRSAEATAELERVRTARPDDGVVRARLAERYEADGRSAEAEAELRSLAEASPDRPAVWERLARFYERTGRRKEAAVASERARAVGGRPERALRPLLPSKR
jgi:predicted Zn-dependent protease